MPLTSVQVCDEIAGLSYRQLDYLCRLGLIDDAGAVGRGSGTRRAFSPQTVDRLRVAQAIREAMPLGSTPKAAAWPTVVQSVMAGPEPPRAGYAIVEPDVMIRYVDDTASLGYVFRTVEIGALVVPFAL